MIIGDLVTHVEDSRIGIGIVVETYRDLDVIDVVWPRWGSDTFTHLKSSLELVDENK